MELQKLANQSKQKLGETVPVWLLLQWENGADNVQLSTQAMSQIANILSTPSVRRVLQVVEGTSPEACNQTVMIWIMAVACLIWENQSDCINQVLIEKQI